MIRRISHYIKSELPTPGSAMEDTSTSIVSIPTRAFGNDIRRLRQASALASILLLLAVGLTAGEKQGCIPTRDAAILKQRENILVEAGKKLLEAFRSDDEDTFLQLVHEKHFGMGESKKYTVSELKELFRKREGMFCYLFDSSCIPTVGEVPHIRLYSFSELSKRPGARIRNAEVWRLKSKTRTGCSGHINFIWPARADEILGVGGHRFTFMYEGGKWLTSGFDFRASSLPKVPRQP